MIVAKIFAAGIIGGLGMTVSMHLIHFSKLARADMVVALGSMFTKRKENSFIYRSIIHVISGIVFAFVYSFISQTFQIESLSSFVFLGLLLGFVHGFFVNFLGVYYKLAGYTLL